MIKHGQTYRYDVYPPLHTGSCPGCGARLSRDEVQLWGSLSAPRLGLPDNALLIFTGLALTM